MKCICVSDAQKKLACPYANECDNYKQEIPLEIDGGTYWLSKEVYDLDREHMKKLEARVLPTWLMDFLTKK